MSVGTPYPQGYGLTNWAYTPESLATLAQRQLNTQMSSAPQAMMQARNFGCNPRQLQNAWSESVDTDYEEALRDLNDEFPGLRSTK